MGRDLRSLRIDRQQATRLVAMIGLVLLGVSVLPGLLESPEPPPVPPDVGFHPGELGRIAEIPQPSTSRQVPEAKQGNKAASDRDAPARHRRKPGAGAREKKRSHRNDRPGEPDRVRTSAAATSETAPSPSSSVAVSVPAPVPASPAPPAPSPAAPDPGQSHPADGSQEFAPR